MHKTLTREVFDKFIRALLYGILMFYLLLTLFPFYMLFVNATRSTLELQNFVSFLPSNYFFKNFNSLVSHGLNIWRAMLNSLIVSVSSTFLSVYFSALTAYGFKVYNFKGNKLMYSFVLFIIMIPGQLGIIGFYQFMLQLGWIDSYLPLILPSIASAGHVFFLFQYFKANLNIEMIEAARIDGSSEWNIFNRIIIPTSIPALATIAIGTFIATWNNYLMPTILISDEKLYTMPLVVNMLKTNMYATDIGAIYNGLFLTVIPLIVVYLLLSRYIVGGVSVGGSKE